MTATHTRLNGDHHANEPVGRSCLHGLGGRRCHGVAGGGALDERGAPTGPR